MAALPRWRLRRHLTTPRHQLRHWALAPSPLSARTPCAGRRSPALWRALTAQGTASRLSSGTSRRRRRPLPTGRWVLACKRASVLEAAPSLILLPSRQQLSSPSSTALCMRQPALPPHCVRSRAGQIACAARQRGRAAQMLWLLCSSPFRTPAAAHWMRLAQRQRARSRRPSILSVKAMAHQILLRRRRSSCGPRLQPCAGTLVCICRSQDYVWRARCQTASTRCGRRWQTHTAFAHRRYLLPMPWLRLLLLRRLRRPQVPRPCQAEFGRYHEAPASAKRHPRLHHRM